MSRAPTEDPYARLTKAELIARVRELEEESRSRLGVQAAVHELDVYQEELRTQHLELIEARNVIEQARDRYEDLFEFAPFAYLTLDASGIVREINHGGCALLGGDRVHLVDSPLIVYVHKDDREAFYRYLRACRNDGRSARAELRLRSRDGRIVPTELFARATISAHNADIRIAITDLTERHRAEEEHRGLVVREQVAKAASEAKDRLLAVVSHELRTPLAPILSAAELLTASRLPSESLAAAETIRRNVETEARLVDDLLEFTRSGAGKLRLAMQPTDAGALIAEVVETFKPQAARRHVALHSRLEAVGTNVQADPARITQIVANLLSNALTYTPAHGKITLSTANEDDRLVVGVSDDGAGIEAQDLGRIFEPFEQARAQPLGQGLGLGLAIAKSLVEAHGGTITARSKGKGHGACFEFTLPLAARLSKPARVAPFPAPGKPHADVHVLIVEDHVDAATALSELLQAHGYRTSVALTFQSALDAARDDFDVLISDIALPDGSGLDLMRALQARRPIRGIALSGFGSHQDVECSKTAGFELHLTKPADVASIIRAIDVLTASDGAPASSRTAQQRSGR